MKATSIFFVAAVCSVALTTSVIAGGHGHGHGHGGHMPRSMPGDGMGMGGGGMGMGMGGIQSQRSFFTNEANTSVQKNSSAPAPKH